MTTLKELAAMLDAATGPNRGLDDTIALSLDGYAVRKIGGLPHFTTPEEMIFAPPGKPAGVPSYTDSVDAALALVERLLPGGMSTYCEQWLNFKLGCVWTWELTEHVLDLSRCETAPTAPLAILKALVAALIAKENTDEA